MFKSTEESQTWIETSNRHSKDVLSLTEVESSSPITEIASVEQFPAKLQQHEVAVIRQLVDIKANLLELLEYQQFLDYSKLEQVINDLMLITNEMFDGGYRSESEEYQNNFNPSLNERYGESPSELWRSLAYVKCSKERAILIHEISMILDRLMPDDYSNPLSTTINNLEKLGSLNRKFAKAQEVFVHKSTPDLMAEIVMRGVLASRAAQLDTYGESNFSTGGLKIEKKSNGLFVIVRNGVRQIFNPTDIPRFDSGLKNPFQEASDVCFSTDREYWGYQKGVKLVMSKSQVLAGHQFMADDGTHVYDYESDDNLSLGLKLDLSKYNYTLIVDDSNEKLFVKSLIEYAKNNSLSIQDIVSWYCQHVTRLNNTSVEEIRKLFFEHFPDSTVDGVFAPTTFFGEAATKTAKPLCEYKPISSELGPKNSTSLLENDIKVIEALFAAVQKEIEQEKFEKKAQDELFARAPW